MDDLFETVAVTYRQPETAVILSMLEHYGVRGYALGAESVRANTIWTLALGGVRIRVERDQAEFVRTLLSEAQTADAPRLSAGDRTRNGLWALVLGLLGGLPPPQIGATIVGPR